MPLYPKEREGKALPILGQDVEFSFWPMRKGTGRHGFQSRIFVTDPWNIMERCIRGQPEVGLRLRARAFLEQAKDFYNASQVGGIRSAKPLLLYYCFMNLAKSFILTKGISELTKKAHHGVSFEFLSTKKFVNTELKYHESNDKYDNIFDLLLESLTGEGFNESTILVGKLMPQVLLGHRLWCYAVDKDKSPRKERFIEINDIKFRYNESKNTMWMYFDILKSECTRLNYTHKKILNSARLNDDWKLVRILDDEDKFVRFELRIPESYNSYPSDKINDLVSRVRKRFWRSIKNQSPYRKYYIQVMDNDDPDIPQIAVIYLIMFYLGSITRYQPDQFTRLLRIRYGPFIQEFIENQPRQWLFMLASEFAEQEVAQAAVV